MITKRLPEPVEIDLPTGPVRVEDVAGALELLGAAGWPARGPRHRDAVDTCLKVQDGHRSVAEAVRALREAAAEARLAAR